MLDNLQHICKHSAQGYFRPKLVTEITIENGNYCSPQGLTDRHNSVISEDLLMFSWRSTQKFIWDSLQTKYNFSRTEFKLVVTRRMPVTVLTDILGLHKSVKTTSLAHCYSHSFSLEIKGMCIFLTSWISCLSKMNSY